MASRCRVSAPRDLTIVGAGLAGSLLATLLARRGWSVDVYERRGDPRVEGYAGGRSINLALAERGLHALRSADAAEVVLDKAVMMRGRMVHFADGRQQLQRYGRDDSEVIWSVSRGDLNLTLIDAAEAAGARLHFDRPLASVDFATGTATFRGNHQAHVQPFNAIVGADGAGSVVRQQINAVSPLRERLEWLDHGHKELEIPPRADGGFSIEPNALHIWPRGRYMCIALPNDERTFTVTLFLPNAGDPSFATVETGEEAVAFFARDFADALPLIPDLAHDYESHPPGSLVARRQGRTDRRCCPRHGAVPRSGHELRVRGLRGACRPTGRRCRPRDGLHHVRSHPPPECAGDPADGARELPRDAGTRGRCRLPAAARARTRARRAPSGSFRSALRDGDLSAHSVCDGAGTWPYPARPVGRSHPGARFPGWHRLDLAR